MAKPIALIAAFSGVALPRILAEIAAGPQPPIADWHVGTYGIDPADARTIRNSGCRYAPVFGIQPSTSAGFREGRKLPAADEAKLEPTFKGPIPGDDVIPSERPRAWGIELGRRYRDAMRKRRQAGVRIETWQFDEILGECSFSIEHRAFVGGILRGLTDGRPKLRDRKKRGFVWTAFTAMTRLPAPTASAEIGQFWRDLDHATLFLVGEEYPFFRGSATSAAATFSEGHRRLAALHPRLAQKYIVGMTPGWIISDGLRGNPPPRSSVATVRTWRQGYVGARNGLQHPSGYGQFNFVGDNEAPDPLRAAVATLQFASEQLAG
jgi:hypothetical protein